VAYIMFVGYLFVWSER